MKHYYIAYEPKADINYFYLLLVYSLAEYNTSKNLFDTVSYKSVRALQKQIESKFTDISISPATLSRFLNDERYSNYFAVDKNRKQIKLHNDIKDMKCFIMLTNREVEFLIMQKDNLLIKYYLYIKHFCGHGSYGIQDYTIKQFLNYIGYSDKSNSYISRISDYNRLLVENGFIKIEQFIDDKGRIRNSYQLL